MQEAKDTIQVTLMGSPNISKQSPLTMAQEGLLEDPDALALMALLFLSLLATPRAGCDPLTPKQTQYADRDRLFKTLAAAQSGKIAKSARNRPAYLLDKINGALSIRQDLEKNTRERGDFGVKIGHLSIDAVQMLLAAQKPHDESSQNTIIRLGEKRLLEGMEYPWLDQPAFQELRRRLDDCYLDALCKKITGLLVRMEGAASLGKFDQGEAYRSEALPLLDKGRERLSVIGGDHPLAPQFARLEARSTHLIVSRDADRAAKPRAHNIPKRVTSFIGREAEMAKLKTLLSTEQIVTITGMGGCGKTRLALQAALKYAEDSGNETRLVELAGVADSRSVPQTVAHVLELPEQKQRSYTDALIERFREGRALLLLDNCEHLIEGCASLVETLVQFCPQLTVLATSRQPLNIEGEYLLRLKPLRFPNPDERLAPLDAPDPVAALLEYEAARLFVERIRPHNDFPVSAEHVASIASICANLDGIPLALELGAACAAALSLHEINELLTDRFQVLKQGRSTALPRHKTLQAVIDWSYDLLTERERVLLCRLSVFAGGWTLEAARSVGASDDLSESDVLGVLTALVDKSLVVAETDGMAGRYRMLETVRQYAGDRLRERGEAGTARTRHRAYFAALAEQAQPHLMGPDPIPWLDCLESEIDNLRAALEWRADAEAMRLACSLHRFWLIRSHFEEGRRWLERACDASETCPSELRATALMGAGNLAYLQGKFQDAKSLLETSLEIWTDARNQVGGADVLYHLGITATFLSDFPEAEARLQESLAIAEACGDEKAIANARQGLGRAAHSQADYDRAQGLYAAVLPFRRRDGDIVELADLLMYMGILATHQGRLAEARDLLNESLSLASRLGRPHQVAQLTGALADMARIEGAYADARTYGEQSLSLMRKVGASLGVAHITNLLAIIAYEQEDFREAENGFEQSRVILAGLGNERSAAAALMNVATMAGKQGDYERAITLYQESLAEFHRFDAWQWIAGCLEDFGLLEAQHHPGRRAVLLLCAADALRQQTEYLRTDAETQRFNQAMDALREAIGEPAYLAASEDARAMTKEEAFAFALEE